MNEDIKEIQKKYNAQAKGIKKGEILLDFINSLTPVLLSLETNNN